MPPHRSSALIRARRALQLAIVVAAAAASALVAYVPSAPAQQSGPIRAYDIPAGPLTGALNRFGEEAGIFLAGNAQLTEGRSTAGLKGSFSAQEGLRRLLEGTGLEAVGDDVKGFSLRIGAAPRTGTVQPDSVMTGRAADPNALPDLTAPVVTVTSQRLHDVGPMPGLAVTREQIPGNVQSVTSEDIKKSHSLNLGSVLNSQMQSVNVNDYQGNPFQMDVTYRGFTASPQLGTPQGLSVFFDGIRVNEPFGDVVNWDLIPVNALASVDMFPGSNPIFGLGTLGGAMSMRTKSGFTDSGASVEVLGGSWGRKQLQLSAGDNNGVVAGFVALSLFGEDGWRDNSPSKVNQMFGKLEWRGGPATIGFSTLLATTDLVGNGLIPLEMYEQRPETVFTSPDETKNELLQFQLSGAFEVTDKMNVTSQVYRRISKRRAVNGDVYGAFDDLGNDHDYGRETSTPANNLPLCQYQDVDINGLPDYYLDVNNNNSADPGEINAPVPPGNIFPINEVPPLNNPTNAAGVCNPSPAFLEPLQTRNGKAALDSAGAGIVKGTPIGQIDKTAIDQVTDGGAIQFNWNLDRHKFMVGGSIDSAYAEYGSTSRLAMIDASHNVYSDPANIDPLYYAASHDIVNNAFNGTSKTGSLYFSETWSALDNLHLSLSARYNQTEIKNNLTARTEAGRVELHNIRDFGAVPDIILCPTPDPASCPSAPNASRRLHQEGVDNGTNGYYRPTGEGFQYAQSGHPERFTYYSLNPSVGASYLPTENLNLFANWNQGTRTPSVIEAGCAFDPDPQKTSTGHCTLPSTLSGDPYLPQIQATTTELGARGTFSNGWKWNTSIYRTDLKDDIYFVGFTPTRNYFDTIGDTRRQGLEFGLSGSSGRFDFRVGYALTHATFQSTFWQSNISNSSTNRDPNNGVPPGLYPYDEDFGGAPLPPGNTTNRGFPTWRLYRIDPGDRMPGIPLHNLNLNVGYRLTEAWSVGLGMIARSSSYARGNENNDHQPGPAQGDQGVLDCNPYFDPDTGDFTGYFQCLPISLSTLAPGQPYLHSGKTPGYAIFSFDTSYRIEKNLTLSFQISNLFDRKYYTASRLDRNPFSPSINGAIGASGFNYNSLDWQNTTFVAPGAPRGYFVSLTYEFGAN